MSISKVVIAFFCVCVLFLLIWMCNYVFLCNGDGVKGPGTRPNNQQRRRHLHLVHFRINDVPEYRLYYARWTQACVCFVVAHKINKQFCNLLLYKNSSVINNIEISRSSLRQMRRRPMANVLHTLHGEIALCKYTHTHIGYEFVPGWGAHARARACP